MTDTPQSTGTPLPTPTGHELGPQLTRFFDWIRSAGVTRGGDRWLAGVCGGIARRTGLDPLIVRGIAIVLAVLGAPVLFAYAVGWALLPDEQGRIHAEQAFRGVFEPADIAIAALLLFTIVPFTRGFWWQGPPVAWGMPNWLATTFTVGWSIAVAIGIVWLVVFLLRRVPTGGYRRTDAQPGTPTGSTGPAGTTGSAATIGATPDATATDATTGAAFTASTPGVSTAPSAWDAVQEQNRTRHEQHRAWREQNRAWRADREQASRERHPGAGFSAIALGLALAAGAIAAGLYSDGTWSTAALLIGLAFALGVLSLGIIVAGIRGRNGGALGGFALLTAATLIVLGLFPQGTQFVPAGAPHWTVGSSNAASVPGYAVIAGRPTIDLAGLDAARGSAGRTIDVWLGFGDTNLVLPTDRPIVVEANSIVGGIHYGGADDRGGLFFHDRRTVNGGDTRAVTQIRVWSLVGQVEINGSK